MDSTTTTQQRQQHHITPNQTSSHLSSSITSSTITTQSNSNNNINNLNPKKRSLDHVTLLQSSSYFKIRAVLSQLRPLFLQVLHAPNFENCEAARGIQEKMKLMIDLSRQNTVENVHFVQCNSGAISRDEKQGEQKPTLMSKPANLLPQADRAYTKSAEEKRFPTGNNLDKQTAETNRIPGTYIVGGSAFGWNFITFHGTKPEYYGRTKEAFRAGK